jgi:hypothetical protein
VPPSSGFLVAAKAVPSSLIHVTMMMEALRSSVMSAFTRATRCNFPEDGILQCLSQHVHVTATNGKRPFSLRLLVRRLGSIGVTSVTNTPNFEVQDIHLPEHLCTMYSTKQGWRTV